MTMAKVQDGQVVEVGLPENLKALTIRQLNSQGWVKVVGDPKPSDETAPGHHWTYGESWRVEGDVVYGEWSETKRPQPYPSWTWVEGEGWVPPVAKPDGDNVWDEDSQAWVQSEGIL